MSCLGEHQMINHFPGMLALTSKSQLATHMRKMQELHPDDYAFMPESWVLPEEHAAFQRECRRNREHSSGAMFIVKPERGCQGRKIFLTNDPDDPAITKAAWYGALGGDALVAQRYIQNPLVFHSEPSDKGFKFDLRLYVIVTSCNPLRVLLYKDGLARFCTEAYSEATADNKDWRFMHLTNFSLNKSNGNFVESLDAADAKVGSKRRLSVLFDYLQAEGHDVPRLWTQLEDMVAKSMLAVLPLLQHYYGLCKPGDKFGDRCIEVLGMDVLLDADLKPWLLEFNHSPSFHVNGCVDEAVKGPLLHDIFDLLAPALEHRAAEYPTARKRSSQALQTGQCITSLAGVHGAGSHGLLKRMRNKVKEHRRERAKAWADSEIDANEQDEAQGKGAASNRRQRQSLEEFALDCPRFYPPGADRCKWARRSREEEEAWVEMREQCEAALSARMKRCYPPSCPLLQAKYAQIEASAAALHNIGPSGRRRSESRKEERQQGADAASSDSDSEGPGPWDDDVGLSDSSESGHDDALPSCARLLDADGSKGSKMWQPAPEEEDVAALSGPQRLLVRCAAIMFGLGLLCPPIMFMSLPAPCPCAIIPCFVLYRPALFELARAPAAAISCVASSPVPRLCPICLAACMLPACCLHADDRSTRLCSRKLRTHAAAS